MASNWRKVALKDIADDITVGFVGPMASEYVPTGIPFLRSQNVLPHRISLQDIKFISEEFYQKIKKSALSPGDVVIVRTGKPGTAAVIPDTLLVSNCSDLVIVRPGNELNAKFLSYYMNGIGQHHVSAHLVGAVQQHFNVGSAKEMKIFLPSRMEQDQIVGILGALDDKIELNRRMNETLEAMAKALFKSWFVDFDPVRAKAEGRPPEGLPPEIATLFPDAFEDSELGEIPKGWEYVPLSELGRIVCGKTPPTSNADFYGGNVPFITIPDMHGKMLITKASKHLSVQGADFQRTKYLPRYSTCVSCIATPGLVVLTTQDSQTNQQINSVIPDKLNQSLFNYFCIKQAAYTVISHGSGGSVFHNLNTGEFSKLKVLLPDLRLAVAFHQLIEPFILKIENTQQISENLAKLRDSILPKLMSGEIRVREAQALVEAV